MRRILIIFCLLLLTVPLTVSAQDDPDHAAPVRAVA